MMLTPESISLPHTSFGFRKAFESVSPQHATVSRVLTHTEIDWLRNLSAREAMVSNASNLVSTMGGPNCSINPNRQSALSRRKETFGITKMPCRAPRDLKATRSFPVSHSGPQIDMVLHPVPTHEFAEPIEVPRILHVEIEKDPALRRIQQFLQRGN